MLKVPAGSGAQTTSTLPPAGEMEATPETHEAGVLRASDHRQTDTGAQGHTTDVILTLAQDEELYHTRW